MDINENGFNYWQGNEPPDLREFFEKISSILYEFAHKHNLRIEKYDHKIPGWEFIFKHPEGGICNIEILKYENEQVSLFTGWWFDEYETGKRYNKHTNCNQIISSIEENTLKKNLYNVLKLALSWKKEDLEPPSKELAPCNWKDKISKEEFEHLNDKYPSPIL